MSWQGTVGHEHVQPYTPAKTQAFNAELRRIAASKKAKQLEAMARRNGKTT